MKMSGSIRSARGDGERPRRGSLLSDYTMTKNDDAASSGKRRPPVFDYIGICSVRSCGSLAQSDRKTNVKEVEVLVRVVSFG